ncbi:hypothetical protein AN639_05760 [Candidatus Epulonipiscium fishelsonii]|nr:hypothetical protein AN639_05760 [Epulopiscium sp. SCG-B05WGA-EpuloA1]
MKTTAIEITTDSNILGERLKHLRTERKLLQKDIAKLLKLSQSAYGFFEQGRRVPDAIILKELSGIFNISVDYILGLTDFKNVVKPNMPFEFTSLNKENLKLVKDYVNILQENQKYQSLKHQLKN